MIIKYEGEDPNHLQHLYPTPSLEGILNVPYQKARLDWIKQQIVGESVLDVGTCSGYVLAYVPGSRKVGLDNSEVRLKLASYEFGDENYTWVLGDATNLPFELGEFDTVLLNDVLEHLTYEDAKKAFKEACQVGSNIIVTVPQSTSSVANNHEHLWSCTKEAVEELLDTACCEYTITSSYCGNFWLVVATPL